MKKIKITTPENIEVEYMLGDLPSRTAAASIDMLIIGVADIALLIAILLINRFAPTFWKNYYGWIVGISMLIIAVFTYGYFIVLELTMNGRTIGKKLLKLRTIRRNGQPITFKHSAIRNLVRLFVDMTGVGVIVMFFSKEHKRVGDILASTIVIHDKEALPVYFEGIDPQYSDFIQYLSIEEKDILTEYNVLKDSYQDSDELRDKLHRYFRDKFEALGLLEQWESYIDNI
ncbi:RDD family protein [Clostridium oryzae]|uniref:RDD family protein n=1 Tax=Clostridium oryzae TaxID=1450648 RepID=A0A1V4IQQ1_9CLOT|nr:RDD family protein [Clostridium oryzae]OPJ62125.1 RDD family protein [Clostridium oryzae]